MKPEFDEGSGCRGKRRFSSLAAGWKAAHRLNKSVNREGGPLTCYRCPACRGHHIGHRYRKS